QTGKLRRGQHTGVHQGVARVVHVHRVFAVIAVDGEQRGNVKIGRASCKERAENVDGVVIITYIHRGLARDGLNVDGGFAIVRVELRASSVRAFDGKGVSRRAQADVERFQRAIRNAVAHAQAGELGVRERAGVRHGVARVVHVHDVVAVVAVDGEQRGNV